MPIDDDDVETIDGARQPSAGGYSVDRLNQEWALVLIGSKAVIVRQMPNAPPEDRIRILQLDAFKALMANRRTEILVGERIKVMTHATRWLADRDRRHFHGIEFMPNPDGASATDGYLNL